jgi:hypothetical protein
MSYHTLKMVDWKYVYQKFKTNFPFRLERFCKKKLKIKIPLCKQKRLQKILLVPSCKIKTPLIDQKNFCNFFGTPCMTNLSQVYPDRRNDICRPLLDH